MADEDDLPEQLRIRREKRAAILSRGGQPYPVSVPRTTSLLEIRTKHKELPIDVATGIIESVTGRVIFKRDTGKLCFANLREGDGTELQAMFSLDKIGEAQLEIWKSEIDLGDIVSVTGEVITSKRGPEARSNARLRPAVMKSLRQTFSDKNFIEVETPMLQVMHGGAAARPFKTFSNAYEMDLFLRIAPELYLKRCVVGGLEKVFEINRNFRNEGADSSHSPEFAMIETYEAYGDWNTMAQLTKNLVQDAAKAVFGSHKVKHHDGRELDLGGDWNQISLFEAISEAVGEKVSGESSIDELKKIATKLGIKLDPKWIKGKIAEEIFEHTAIKKLTAPTFVMGFPIDTSPLVRAHRETPGVAEKWDLYVEGFELATGYSELVDPVIQRERLVEQAKLGASGDLEAMGLDEDFLKAMEHGMPPMGGMGMGVDRLLMALTGLGIRETILFPLVKPTAGDE